LKYLRTAGAWVSSSLDRRDITFVAGIALLWHGGETLYPGAGFAACGVVCVALAAFGVR